jgi:hypothetical protein
LFIRSGAIVFGVCNEGFVEREFSTRAIIHVEPGKDRLDKPLLGKPEGTCNLVSTDLRSEQHGRFLDPCHLKVLAQDLPCK